MKQQKMENNITYTIQEVKKETANVVTLTLVYDGIIPSLRAGQFITVFFSETGHMEGKSYSISNIIANNSFTITVKNIGVFSNKLSVMKAGDTLSASLPYGYFYTESETSSLVLISGGIGVAPFKSMIEESFIKTPSRKIVLFYANKTPEDIIFYNEWNDLVAKQGDNFQIHHYITQREVSSPMKNNRIPIADILGPTQNLSESEFFLCGSIAFVRDYWKALKSSGIKDEQIYTEAFF